MDPNFDSDDVPNIFKRSLNFKTVMFHVKHYSFKSHEENLSVFGVTIKINLDFK